MDLRQRWGEMYGLGVHDDGGGVVSPSRTDEPGGARIGPEAAQALGSRMLFDGEGSCVSGKKVWMPGARKKEAVCCIKRQKGGGSRCFALRGERGGRGWPTRQRPHRRRRRGG